MSEVSVQAAAMFAYMEKLFKTDDNLKVKATSAQHLQWMVESKCPTLFLKWAFSEQRQSDLILENLPSPPFSGPPKPFSPQPYRHPYL